ncbi:MAG TPA: hypothetical protein VF840_02775, partial [Terriglobales bacterium]
IRYSGGLWVLSVWPVNEALRSPDPRAVRSVPDTVPDPLRYRVVISVVPALSPAEQALQVEAGSKSMSLYCWLPLHHPAVGSNRDSRPQHGVLLRIVQRLPRQHLRLRQLLRRRSRNRLRLRRPHDRLRGRCDVLGVGQRGHDLLQQNAFCLGMGVRPPGAELTTCSGGSGIMFTVS